MKKLILIGVVLFVANITISHAQTKNEVTPVSTQVQTAPAAAPAPGHTTEVKTAPTAVQGHPGCSDAEKAKCCKGKKAKKCCASKKGEAKAEEKPAN